MDRLEFHPLANLFPMMTDEETNDLGEDMLRHGQREPIWKYDDMILDGRNRYNACLQKDIEPRFAEFRGADPVAFVVSLNLRRRHLDDAQRAIIAAKLATMKRGDNQHSPNGETSQAKAAKLLNVSKRRVERTREVIEKGVPDLVDAVENGAVKVSAAAEFAMQNPPIEQARLIAEAGSAAAAVKASRPDLTARADRAAVKQPKPVPDVRDAADRAEAQADRAAQRRMVSEGIMRALALFERDNIDPPDRAAAIIERFDLAIAEASGTRKFSVARVRRAIEAMTIVFTAITAELEV